MRIVHVVDSMEVGGAEVLVADLCRLQQEQGHDVSISCLFRRGLLGEALERDGFAVRVHGPGGLLRTLPRLWRFFRHARPDVVQCHNATPAIYAAAAARLTGAHCVLDTRHGLVAPPYRKSLEWKFAVAARFCHAIVGVCQATQRNLEGAPGAVRGKITTVYNGAREPLPAEPGQAAVPPVSGFTLVHVARLAAAKDQATLVRAIALARKDVPKLQAWIVGGGPLLESLTKLAQALDLGGCLHFLGEQKRVRPFLEQAQLFVLSSISEALPVSLLEAMALGLPAVVSDVGAMPEVVRAAGCGLVVPSSDPQSLADAIVQLATHPAALHGYGKAARQAYLARFTLLHMADRYMEIYRNGLR